MAGSNIIPYRTRGQKQRHDENEKANANRCSALKDYTKPNTKVKTQRQKVPDDEDIDIDKIVKGDKPKDCYIVGLGLNRKFIDLLFKRSVIKFIKISSHLDFIVSEIIYNQTDTLTQRLMGLR